MIRRFALWMVMSGVLCPVGLWAEPYFAAWKGMNCNACHVNQVGGWVRTNFGKTYGNGLRTFDWQGLADPESVHSGAPPSVSVGLDIHAGYHFYKYEKPSSPLFMDTGLFDYSRYSFSAHLKANEFLSGVATLRPGNNGEVYGLLSGLSQGGYAKVGIFTLPYGLMLADDSSLVRSQLSFSFERLDSGVEAGIFPDPFFIQSGISFNGTQRNFSARGGVQFREFTFGGSVYGENFDKYPVRILYNVFGWGRLEPVVILLEFDGGYDSQTIDFTAPGSEKPDLGHNDYWAYHASAEVDLGRDVYLRGVSEWFDRSIRLPGPFIGFRHGLVVRCYPAGNLKLQVEGYRMDATSGPSARFATAYNFGADAFFFY